MAGDEQSSGPYRSDEPSSEESVRPSQGADVDPQGQGREVQAEPIDLEPVEVVQAPRRDAPHAAVTPEPEAGRCRQCGAALDPSDELCLRCGLRVGPDAAAEADATTHEKKATADDAEPTGPLAVPTRSPAMDFWLPVVLGSAAVFALIVGHLAGVIALFPQVRVAEDVAAVPWSLRFTGLLRTLILLVFWTGCGIAGLFALSSMLNRQFGDARLATLRMGAIMATIRLSTFIAIPGPRWIEWMTETIVQAGGFILLTMLLFGLVIRNAAILAGWTLMAILTLWLFSFAVQWALSPA